MKHLGCQLTPASKTNLPFDKSCFFLIFSPATPSSGQKSTSLDFHVNQQLEYFASFKNKQQTNTHTHKILMSLITGRFHIVCLVLPCVLSLKHDLEARQKHCHSQQNDLLSRKFSIVIMPRGYAKKEVPHRKQMNKNKFRYFQKPKNIDLQDAKKYSFHDQMML